MLGVGGGGGVGADVAAVSVGWAVVCPDSLLIGVEVVEAFTQAPFWQVCPSEQSVSAEQLTEVVGATQALFWQTWPFEQSESVEQPKVEVVGAAAQAPTWQVWPDEQSESELQPEAAVVGAVTQVPAWQVCPSWHSVSSVQPDGVVVGATQAVVTNWQDESQLNVPVYPGPTTLSQVSPPSWVPSQSSLLSNVPFPQAAVTSGTDDVGVTEPEAFEAAPQPFLLYA